jgi:hypothetical protein
MQTHVFRSSIRDLWIGATLFAGVPGAALFYFLGGAQEPGELVLAGAVAVVLAALFAVAVACFPVYVRDDGLRCYNFYGVYQTLPWAAITNVRQESMFGFGYLIVGDGEREIWVPLYLSDMQGFARTVRTHVGDQHPLAVALRGYAD